MAERTDPVAVIGTGSIGRAVTRRLLDAGRPVVVWNRSPDPVAELVRRGARSAGSVAEAVAAGDPAFFALPDPTVVRDCLRRVREDLAGRTVVVLCTGTPSEARLTAEHAAALGARCLQAGIQASAAQIFAGAATLLYSGSAAGFGEHRTVLEALGWARFVGEAAEAAALWDLALFGLWYDAQLGLLRALAAARDAGVDLDAFAETAQAQLGHVVSGVPATLREVRTGEHPPGPADLGQHLEVVRRLVALRTGTVLGDGGLADVAALLADLVQRGHGSEGITATTAR